MTETTVPVLPESVTEGTLATQCKREGGHVKHDDVIAELETDKVILKIPTLYDGVLSNIIISEDSTIASAQLLAHLKPQAIIEETVTPVTETLAMPSARLEVQRSGVELTDVAGSGRNGCILKEDTRRATPVPIIQPERVTKIASAKPLTPGAHQERRESMSRLRQRTAERLLAFQQNNAILITSSEVNMQSVMDLHTRWKNRFIEEHGVKLGFMSFFVRAVTRALERFLVMNASVDDNEITWRSYCDIGTAVNSNRGLVAPVLCDARSPSLVEIERQIAEYTTQARNGKLPLEALQGGTFSITNGGIFGSMMSTSVINPPQSAILGMHVATPCPAAENDQVVIRPMMYLALSYDHHIIDDQEAVQTLVAVRELLESLEQLLLDL